MKKLLENKLKISLMDQKALEHYLAETPQEWIQNAVKGMVNKAIKCIMRDYLEIYKSKHPGNIPANYIQLIPAIVAMPEFKKYNHGSPENEVPPRKELPSRLIVASGIDIEDYEWTALENFYLDPEQTMEDLFHNKIAKRKKAFCKEYESKMLTDPQVAQMPSSPDDMIDLIVNKPDYKNRVQRDASNII